MVMACYRKVLQRLSTMPSACFLGPFNRQHDSP
jgi:hypothetical protein